MPQPTLELDAPIGLSRYLPPGAIAETARAYEASGVIGSVSVWDQLNFFHPRSLWTEENTPMAALIPDIDSFPDAFATLAYASCAAPGLGITVATDAVRRSPAELTQTMLTLQNMTGGKARLQLGAGEIKQCKPYGWKRKEGLGRMEDLMRAMRELYEADGPIDFEGNHWNFQQAWIGNAKPARPRVWGLGGGPKLLEVTARYADGFSTMAPAVAYTPERWAEIIENMRKLVAEQDRDPDEFEFALFPCGLMIHEDENVIDRALENPVIKWMTAVFGRINQADWEQQGMEPPRPDWHYALKLLPNTIGDAERDEVLARVTREHSEKSWIFGTPEQVAEQLLPYAELGTTWMHLADVVNLVTDPEDAQQTPARTIEVARILREKLGEKPEPALAGADSIEGGDA
jgi:phthiodiolone/phenolphthiodiolone dimycocerosates ketoreductase